MNYKKAYEARSGYVMAGAFVSASGLIACVDPCLDTLARAALGISGRLHLLVSDDPCSKDLFPVLMV
jgi:hypothetical protein